MSGGFFEFREQVAGRRPADSAPAPAGSDTRAPLSVTQLTARIERALQSRIPETLLVRGEISNAKPYHASGHLYFTMKDRDCCIDCVMWKSDVARMKFAIKDGQELLASGRIGIYGKTGRYQLYVTTLRPIGQGALELAFQQMRAKLEAEGLFAVERKRPIPPYPRTVVIVTSSNAAALQDMLKVFRRFPWIRLLLYPVPVQGDGAATKIAAALKHLGRSAAQVGGADLIILSRGGGSLEDLWAFNEEVVARAVAASLLPVVTGIGHEVDVSIADLVADYHAHTPTEAAQVVTAPWRNARETIDVNGLRLCRAAMAFLGELNHRLNAIARHETFRRPLQRIHQNVQYLDGLGRAIQFAWVDRVRTASRSLVELAARLDGRLPRVLRDRRDRVDRLALILARAENQVLRRSSERVIRASARLAECHPRHRLVLRAQQVDGLGERLARDAAGRLSARAVRVDALEGRLRALSPAAVLRRGYSITTRKRDGTVIRSAALVRPGDRLLTRLADGEVQSTAEDSAQLPLFE